MPRDNLAGSSSRCPAARDALLSRCTLTTRRSHRTIDPHALKIPARRAEYSLTENVASPFQERDVTKDAEAVAELQRVGYMTTPVTVIDGTVIVGFDAAKIEAAVGS